MTEWPVVMYSKSRAVALFGFSEVVLLGMSVVEFQQSSYGAAALLLFGSVVLAASIVETRRRFRRGPIALARDGDYLIGGDLPEPLPVAETVFRIRGSGDSWSAVLISNGRTIQLSPGAWRSGRLLRGRAFTRGLLLSLGIREG